LALIYICSDKLREPFELSVALLYKEELK